MNNKIYMNFKILFLSVILVVQANAQFFAGIKTGVNYSNQFYTYQTANNSSNGYTYSPNNNRSSSSTRVEYLGNGMFNMNVGADVGFALKRLLTIQTELAYMPTGFIFTDNANNNVKINYLQWNPIILKFHSGRKKHVQFFVSTGLAVAFPLVSVINTPGSTIENPNDPFEAISVDKIDILSYTASPDGSLLLGIGLDIPVGNGKIGIEGRYQGSFTNIYKGEFASSLGESIYNSNLIAQLGYGMYLSK